MGITRLVRSLPHLLRRPRTLDTLLREENIAARAVGRAVSEAIRGELAPEERDWVNRIESLRSRLIRSDRDIVRLDFGAGGPADQRPPEVQRQGVRVPGTLGEITRTTSKPPFWGLLLFKILRHARPAAALELGTAVGLSAAYQAAALQLNGAGRLVSMEGDPTVAGVARESWTALGLHTVDVVIGNFLDTLDAQLERSDSLGFAFIDGHHDEHATVRYFERIRYHMADPAILVFDDIRWSPGMERGWRRIVDDETVTCVVDFGDLGLCVMGGARASTRTHHVPLHLTALRYHRRLKRA